MAGELPDALRLGEIKYGEKASAAERSTVARQLLEAGRTAEALDLFLIAQDETGVGEVLELALAEGRPSLLVTLEHRGREVPARDWKRAGDSAMKHGRWRQAYRCYKVAGDDQGLAAVQEKIPDYEINIPQGK